MARRCLLITPLTFYSFHVGLQTALEARGWQVDLCNEEFPATTFGKILGKLRAFSILRRTTLAELRRRYGDGSRYDLVLIVKGRGLGREAIGFLHSIAERVVAYNFDSFTFNPSPLDWLDAVDRYATFDIRDAQARGLPLVHLFSSAPPDVFVEHREVDLSIIMRVHSQRLAYVDEVLRALDGRRVSVFLYQSSKLAFLVEILRRPVLCLRLWRHISFTPLSYRDAMAMIARSKATLDYAHDLQTGITVRCFEAQSLGTRVITNNLWAVESGVFEDGALLHHPLGGDARALATLVDGLPEAPSVPFLRSIDRFLEELIADPSSPEPNGGDVSDDIGRVVA